MLFAKLFRILHIGYDSRGPYLAKVTGNRRPQPSLKNAAKINDNIKFPQVRLVGADGEPVGVVSIEDAMGVAEEANLDLVVVAENADPPVCKILDYGKYKYEQHKKKTESRKKQKTVSLKEVQLRPSIGNNDLLTKCKAIRKFIEAGDKVKLVLRFRGREMSKQEIGKEVVQKVIDYSEEFAKPENSPKLEGNSIMTILIAK